MGDHGLVLLLKQLNQALLLGNQGVDLGSFTVEKSGDCMLLINWRQRQMQGAEEIPAGTWHLGAIGRAVDKIN